MVELLEGTPKNDRQKAFSGLHLASQYSNRILSSGSLPPTSEMIREINRRVLWYFTETDEARKYLGSYRTTSAILTDAYVQPPSHHDLVPRMKQACESADESISKIKTGVSYVESNMDATSKIHYNLVINHPFPDGNGRTCRSVVDVLLRRSGLKRIIIAPVHKDDYLSSLDNVSKTGKIEYFTLFLMRRLKDRYSHLSKVEEPYAIAIQRSIKKIEQGLAIEALKKGQINS